MHKKEWTVIMYLNGNNELSIEMENTFEHLCKIKKDNVNIVVQLSKAPIELVRLIRQDKSKYKDDWSGTRRYSIEDGKLQLLQSYKHINMADYKSLYSFIEYSVENFPADRYMLVISGHGFIVASLSDLCGDNPYIMGMYEMCTAINSLKKELKINIDILALDICNMNTVELIYELGKEKSNTVKYLMTYINNGPLDGIDYRNIVGKLDNKPTDLLLKDIVNSSEENIVVAEIKHGKLEKIRQLSDRLSYYWLLINDKIATNEDIKIYNNIHKTIEKVINQLVVCAKNNEEKKSLLHLMFYNKYQIVDIESFTKFYYKLSFTKNNYCSNLIGKKKYNESANIKESVLEQEVLDKRDVELFVRNFNGDMISDKKVEETVNKIYKCNNWTT